MNALVMKLRILLRAELALIKVDAQRRSNMLVLSAISIGCVFVALVFANIGAFFALSDSSVDAKAAFMLAGGNLLLALIPQLLKLRTKPGHEEQMVREIREMAMNEVTKDLDGFSQEFAAIGTSIKQVKSGFSSLSGSAAPVLAMAINLLKKSKTKKQGAQKPEPDSPDND